MGRTAAISLTSALRWVKKEDLAVMEGALRVDIVTWECEVEIQIDL